MTNEIKVVLTILGIEGRTRHFAGKKKMKSELVFKDRKTGKEFTRVLYYKIPTYEYVPVSKRINLTLAFYNYATSIECPEWFCANHIRKDLVRKWERMSKTQRLEEHLKQITVDNRGKDFSYNILED